jgi:hypothetical protein
LQPHLAQRRIQPQQPGGDRGAAGLLDGAAQGEQIQPAAGRDRREQAEALRRGKCDVGRRQPAIHGHVEQAVHVEAGGRAAAGNGANLVGGGLKPHRAAAAMRLQRADIQRGAGCRLGDVPGRAQDQVAGHGERAQDLDTLAGGGAGVGGLQRQRPESLEDRGFDADGLLGLQGQRPGDGGDGGGGDLGGFGGAGQRFHHAQRQRVHQHLAGIQQPIQRERVAGGNLDGAALRPDGAAHLGPFRGMDDDAAAGGIDAGAAIDHGAGGEAGRGTDAAFGPGAERDPPARCGDAGGGGGVDGAAGGRFHHLAGQRAFDPHAAPLRPQRDLPGAGAAAGVHKVLQHAGGGPGGQQHAAALGLDRAGLRHQHGGAGGGGGDLARDVQRQQAIAREVQREGLPPRQRHAAEPGADGAGIGHLRADQRGQALLRHGDAAAIFDAGAGARGAIEHHPPLLEILVGDVGGGGDQRRHIHLRPLVEQHPRRIDQRHPAIRGNAPRNGGGVTADHPVQRPR